MAILRLVEELTLIEWVVIGALALSLFGAFVWSLVKPWSKEQSDRIFPGVAPGFGAGQQLAAAREEEAARLGRHAGGRRIDAQRDSR